MEVTGVRICHATEACDVKAGPHIGLSGDWKHQMGSILWKVSDGSAWADDWIPPQTHGAAAVSKDVMCCPAPADEVARARPRGAPPPHRPHWKAVQRVPIARVGSASCGCSHLPGGCPCWPEAPDDPIRGQLSLENSLCNLGCTRKQVCSSYILAPRQDLQRSAAALPGVRRTMLR